MKEKEISSITLTYDEMNLLLILNEIFILNQLIAF